MDDDETPAAAGHAAGAPGLDAADETPNPASSLEDRGPRIPGLPPKPRRGGIRFDDPDDDDDLEAYMHPDDVPSKEPPSGDS